MAIGRKLRTSAEFTGDGFPTADGGDGPLTLKTGGVASSKLADSGVTAGTYTSVTVNAKGQVTGGTNPSAGAPNKNEQLAVTGASIAVAGINTSTSVIMHFRNGVLQTSSHYTVGLNSITPTSAGGGSYVDEDLQTFWWD